MTSHWHATATGFVGPAARLARPWARRRTTLPGRCRMTTTVRWVLLIAAAITPWALWLTVALGGLR